MSFFSNFTSLFQQKKLNPAIFGFFSPTVMPRMGEREFLKAYRGWVYACTNAVAKRVADIEIKFQQKTDTAWEDIHDHQSLDLLRKVNNFYSFYDLAYATQAYLELDGNAFWYIPQNGNQVPSEIWILEPTRVSVVKSKTEYVSGYVFTNEQQVKVPLEPEEIIHFKKFNPLNAYRGMGTVEAAAIAIDIDTYASEWQRNFFGNSAMPSAILSTAGTLNQEQYDRIKANWESKFKGVSNAHKMALLEGGMTFTPINPTNRDMQFAEGRKDIRNEILGIFQVPKPILGILEDVNLASAQVAEYIFAKDRIRPDMKFFVNKLTEFYLPLFKVDTDKYRIWFTDPVPENIEQKLLIIRSGRNEGNWMTANEARAMFGYPERAGADELDQSTFNTPIPDTDKPDDQGHTDQDEDEEDTAENEEKGVKKNFKKIQIKKIDESYKNEQIDKFKKTYLDLNKKLETQILENLKNEKQLSKPYEQKTLIERLKDAVDPANDLVRILFSNYSDWVGLIYNASHAGMRAIMEKSGKEAMAQLNVDASFDVDNPRAITYLKEHALEDSTSYSDTMKADIAQVVTDGVEQGQSRDEIASSLAQFFDDTNDYRTERIARTECLPGDTLVDAAVIEAVYRRWYTGKMVEIVTRGGRKFSATPNHPMLTSRGWLAAGEVLKGDNLICDNREQGFVSTRNKDIQAPPATLREIFDSAEAISISERKLTSSPDFHGDGMDGYVDILRPNRTLRIGNFTPLYEPVVNSFLESSDVIRTPICASCRRLLSIDKQLCRCGSAKSDTSSFKAVNDNMVTDTEGNSNLLHGLTSEIAVNNEVRSNVLTESGMEPLSHTDSPNIFLSSQDASILKKPTEPLVVSTELLSDSINSKPRQVELDEVISVSVKDFSGHVYNLSTPYGYYTISHVFTGNTIAAYSQSNLESYKQSGVVSGKTWWFDNGNCTSGECPGNVEDGVIDLDADFSSGDDAPPAHPNCLLRDAKIQTDKEIKYIQDIQVGDKVLTHKGRFKPVVALSKREYEGELITLSANGIEIAATLDHPFLTQDGWKYSKDIIPTDYLFFLDELNLFSKIKGFFAKRDNFKGYVYNFEVKDDHSYVANGIVSHNCECDIQPVIQNDEEE